MATVPRHLQRVLVVARTVAGRTRGVDAGHEQQLHADEAFALAGFAAALGDVEREPTGVVVAPARGGCRGVQLAHRVEQAGVGGQVGARRAPDGLLVDTHQPANRIGASMQAAARGQHELGRAVLDVVLGLRRLVPKMGADELHQRLAHETGLAGAGDARDRREQAQRKARVHVVQVVAGHAAQFQPSGGHARRPRVQRRLREQVLCRA